MNFETCMYALTVAGLAFGLGYLVGRAADRSGDRFKTGGYVTNTVTEIDLKGGKLPVQPLARLPKVGG